MSPRGDWIFGARLLVVVSPRWITGQNPDGTNPPGWRRASSGGAGLGMRRDDRRMDPKRCWEFLEIASVGRLGLIAGGEPYVVPVHHVVMDGAIYFHSAPEGRKIDALRENAVVCFETDILYGIRDDQEPCAMGSYYRSVIIYGSAERITDEGEALRALELLVEKHSRRPDRERMDPSQLNTVAVIRITPQRITGKELEAPRGSREPV